ncbi:LOW QUALITY PROTEIN: hypothetical protein TorRG33x02_217500 [Trema orientale]|uniref:Uncharacterized protein n=1 Tax=Trema orientale TaxID=63057 RepID=A0A2P5EAC8_TREOI|nr:LOW QUALITY PROTEIN: hypothetical protein TorRG33x02_217500 [Trema orientale]
MNARDVMDSNGRMIQLYGHWLKGVSQTISCFVPNLQHSNFPVGNKKILLGQRRHNSFLGPQKPCFNKTIALQQKGILLYT